MKYTNKMMNLPLNTKICTLPKGLKTSQWKRYRVVREAQGSCVKYKVHSTGLEFSFGLPVLLGGKGLIHPCILWGECDISMPPSFDSLSEAILAIEEDVSWRVNYESEKTEEIIYYHKEEK